MKKALTLLLMVVVAFGAFASGSQQQAGQASGAEFIIANGAEPETLDPHLISGVPEHRIYMALFEGLVGYDAKTANAVPGVAKSWDISDDGTVYTFHLRDAVWSDGTPITAQTFVDSWIRMLNPDTAAPYAWFPSMFIKGAQAYNGGDASADSVGVKAIDDKTLQVTLVGPLPYVLGALAHYSFSPVPIHAVKQYGEKWTLPENFVGNGPFTLQTWSPQEKLTVVPNDKYWDAGAVKLGSVTFLPVDNINTMYNMYLNGEADWSTDVPLDQLDAAKLRDDYHVSPQLATYYYVFNTQRKPFSDPRVRKALTLAVDRQQLVEVVTRGGQIPANSIVPKMTGYPGIEGNGYNIEQAQKLLADAGFPGGKGFPEFTMLYNTSENHQKIAEYVQQQWLSNLGINATLENQEWKTYLATRRAGNFDVARAGWVGDYQDPNTFLDMFVSGSAMNGGKYANSKYDQLISQAAKMEAGPKRMKTLEDAEKLLITQDQAILPLYFYVNQNMIDTGKWGGWYDNVMDIHPVKDIFVKQ